MLIVFAKKCLAMPKILPIRMHDNAYVVLAPKRSAF